MESQNRAFKGVWIPAEVWLSDELTIYEKAVYAEIDSLDGENHCWASNEYLAEFCKMSVPTISRAISKLIQLGYIEKLSFDGRQRVLAVNKNISQIRETYLGDKSEISPRENLQLIENKKENSIEKPEPPASSKISHSRGFRRERQSLEDKLFSGEEIASQKKERKKESKYNRCLSEIDKRDFTDREKELLRQHIEWSFHSSDANRNKEPGKYAQHLDELLKLKGDKEKIIQRSIDKKWHCFYEFKSQNNTNSYLDHSDSKIQLQTLSQEEAEAVLARDREEFGTI